MPRDKKIIHRSTSDIEDEAASDEEPVEQQEDVYETQSLLKGESDLSSCTDCTDVKLNEERKKYLKDVILRRTLALKQQRERDRQQKVSSTTQKY